MGPEQFAAFKGKTAEGLPEGCTGMLWDLASLELWGGTQGLTKAAEAADELEGLLTYVVLQNVADSRHESWILQMCTTQGPIAGGDPVPDEGFSAEVVCTG